MHVTVSTSRIVWDNRAAFCSICRPLTEQKQDKMLLGESEARFRAFTDPTKDAIIMMDGNGHLSREVPPPHLAVHFLRHP